MPVTLPRARLGVVLSSGNWPVETYFRAYAPPTLGIHVTRMRMGSGGGRAPADIDRDVLGAAALVADAGVDLIDLQATGIVMERGPDGEAALVAAIAGATGIPAYTATQAVVEALRLLGVGRLVMIGPYGPAAIGRESAYLEAAGFTVVDAVGLELGVHSAAVPPEGWLASARERDRSDADGFFFSGSDTRMLEAIAPVEQALGKPAVTSVQAALWGATRRLAAKIRDFQPSSDLGRLFEI
jgi:maleate cis-trans isomerase